MTDALAGKSGKGLVASIRRASRPSQLVNLNDVAYTLYDPFEGMQVRIDYGHMPAGYEPGHMVPSWWWEDGLRADTLNRDLHNFLPLMSHAAKALSERRPGEISEVTADYTRWSVGWSEVYGTKTDLYAPPVDMRGRIARAYFYVATLYHDEQLRAEGYMMMKPDYPYLTPYAINLLCKWNREQAPDDNEQAWDAYVAGMQGAGNPFVTAPELAEYIWGDKAGEVYAVEGEAVPLHSTYRIGRDRVYLFSPHVPEDAVWSIDGVQAMSGDYDSRDLGIGAHHLTYTSASTGRNGRVLINIVEE